MGILGTAIKEIDAFAEIYSDFFDMYNKGGQTKIISKKIVDDNWEILEMEGEKNSLWCALAIA